MKLGRAKIALVAIGGLLVLLGVVWLIIPRRPLPSASLEVLGYSWSFVRERNKEMPTAVLKVTNVGSSAFIIDDFAVHVTPTVEGETNSHVFQAHRAMVLPSESETVSVVLEPGARSWACSLRVYESSTRDVMRVRLQNRRFPDFIRGALPKFFSFFSNEYGPDINILTPTFQVPANATTE